MHCADDFIRGFTGKMASLRSGKPELLQSTGAPRAALEGKLNQHLTISGHAACPRDDQVRSSRPDVGRVEICFVEPADEEQAEDVRRRVKQAEQHIELHRRLLVENAAVELASRLKLFEENNQYHEATEAQSALRLRMRDRCRARARLQIKNHFLRLRERAWRRSSARHRKVSRART